jgi:CheY-like chemotaxis protein
VITTYYETNRLILREMLVRNRASVTEASSGAEALAELARARAAGRPYRLMLLDYRMPAWTEWRSRAKRSKTASYGRPPAARTP